jgi:hypothetical protein
MSLNLNIHSIKKTLKTTTMTPKLKAYLQQIESGNLKNRRTQIINLLLQHPCTLKDFRGKLDIQHQSLTSALSVLCDEGLVMMKEGQDPKYSIFYVITDGELQEKIAKQRYELKKEAFFKQGVKQGYIRYNSEGEMIFS